MSRNLTFDRKIHFDIKLDRVLDELEDTMREYSMDYLGFERGDMELVDEPRFWAIFWQSLAAFAAEQYQDELEEPDTDDGFEFLDEDGNALSREDRFPPSQYELNP